MRQFLLLAVVFLGVSNFAFAEVFDCTFSEPSVNLKYNSKTEELSQMKDLLGEPEITRNVSFHILSGSIFVLKGSDGKQVAQISLNNNGSDGISPTLYPFEIDLASMKDMANNGIGGCTSSMLKSVKGGRR